MVDKKNHSRPYLLGRLYAVIEKLGKVRSEKMRRLSLLAAATQPISFHKAFNDTIAEIGFSGATTAGRELREICDMMQGIEFPKRHALGEIGDFYAGYYHELEYFETSDDAGQGRYMLQRSKDEGYWIATDKEMGVVAKFREKHFNDDQQFTVIGDEHDAKKLAEAARGIAEYLRSNHPGII